MQFNFTFPFSNYNIVTDFSIALVSLCYIKRVNSMSDCHVRPTASCRQDGTTKTANQV